MHLYLDDRGSCHGSLYSDDGDGYTLGRVDYFDYTQKAGKWQLKWHGEGEADFPYNKVEIITHGLEVGEIWSGDVL